MADHNLLPAGVRYSIGLYFRDIKNEFPVYLKLILGIVRLFRSSSFPYVAFTIHTHHFKGKEKPYYPCR